ncbi:MAG: hypothetical protein LBM75_06145 [Myxococcales bacterium]|jgi:hypothetical protein|nr:hypothetical protein [Myxococcales bacterium]
MRKSQKYYEWHARSLRGLALLIAVLGLALAACSDDGGSSTKKPALGEEGSACGAGNSCRIVNGQALACIEGTCQIPDCAANPGIAGCVCQVSACAEGHVCVMGQCQVDSGQPIEPPGEAKCYTPCGNGIERADGTYLACSADKLIEGCLDGATCVNGTCRLQAQDQSKKARSASAALLSSASIDGSCEQDVDCPDHQNCVQGTCYSTCDTKADCRGDRVCRKHACRIPCDTLTPCAVGYACQIDAQDTGICLPVAQGDLEAELSLPSGSFSLSTNALSFTTGKTEGSFTIENDTDRELFFVVSKASHREYSGDGHTLITENPLFWISMGQGENPSFAQDESMEVKVASHGSTKVHLKDIENTEASGTLRNRFVGTLHVSNIYFGTQSVQLNWARTPEGRWSGNMMFIANFPETGLAPWIANPSGSASSVGNALIQRWVALRSGNLSIKDFNAALESVRTGSWKLPAVKEKCAQGAACYPVEDGFQQFASNTASFPVPSGVVELPFEISVRAAGSDATAWDGRIESSQAMHYPGNPAFSMRFGTDPSTCASSANCITQISQMEMNMAIGGRFPTSESDLNCTQSQALDYKQAKTPWLLDAFGMGSVYDSATNTSYRYECRDTALPLDPSATEAKASNFLLSASNPIPDGAPRHRTLRAIDGIMLDQSQMLVLFQEITPSFLVDDMNSTPPTLMSTYGFLILTKTGSPMADADFVAQTALTYAADDNVDITNPTGGVTRLPMMSSNACSPELIQELTGRSTVTDWDSFAGILVDGVADITANNIYDNAQVHWLCKDNGLIDGGKDSIKTACPLASEIVYFTTSSAITVDTLPCQTLGSNGSECNAGEECAQKGCDIGKRCEYKGSCTGQILSGTLATTSSPVSASILTLQGRSDGTSNDGGSCVGKAEDRANPVDCKIFYKDGAVGTQGSPSFEVAVASAFAYKVRFQDRQGRGIGFVPDLCDTGSPYCYSAQDIEKLAQRVDCMARVYERTDLSNDSRAMLQAQLSKAFGHDSLYNEEGFERLYAELLIMLGDDANTQAFASRFDLAGQNALNFQGSLFEPDGIDLTGGAGFEMHSFYKAAQYYQAVLDRYYQNAETISRSLARASGNFIGIDTVVYYLDKVIAVAAKKANAWSEISKRYSSFNRPDLARHVIERSYGQAYMESSAIVQLMRRIAANATPAQTTQIANSIDTAQLTMRMALADMRSIYTDIQDETSFYGLKPDEVPFPALSDTDQNAFVKAMARARSLAATAANKESEALQQSRDFDVDSAKFQAELSLISGSADDQLGEICGTFAVGGAIYPAVPQYAFLNPDLAGKGNPCGSPLVGNGALWDAYLSLQANAVELTSLRNQRQALDEFKRSKEEEIEAICGVVADFSKAMVQLETGQQVLEAVIDAGDIAAEVLDLGIEIASNARDTANCSVGTGTSCPQAIIGFGVYAGIAAGVGAAKAVVRAGQLAAKQGIMAIENEQMQHEIMHECEIARTSLPSTLKEIFIRYLELEGAMAAKLIEAQSIAGSISKMVNDVTSIIATREESESRAIAIEAARNDPNVRIFRNDAVSAADRTFYAALKEAFRATRVFEYYTSQSWALRDKLYLVRMISAGMEPLDAYLDDLEQAFVSFEEQYGNPDLRVMVLSLRDDILRIPRVGEAGAALPESSRTQLFREQMGSVTLLDGRGYISMPFSTTLSQTSPLTRNHKVRWVEAALIGDDLGDDLGRLYLTQDGSGTIRDVNGDYKYYVFPARTAVINPFFNGFKPFAQDVYQNERLRDRPLVNQWKVLFNRKDEEVNKDVQIGALKDIQLFIYYTDFTEL